MGSSLASTGVGGAGTFSPSSLPNLALWLEAVKEGLANGATVSTAHDWSGNGRNATASGTVTYNSAKKGFDFAAGSCNLTTSAFFDTSYNTAFTAVVVVEGDNSAGTKVHTSIGSGYFGDRNGPLIGYATGGLGGTIFVPVSRNLYCEIFRYDGTTQSFFANGFAYNRQAVAGSMGLNGDSLVVGQFGGGFQWTGTVRAVLIGNQVWTDAQLRLLSAYLGFTQNVNVICDGNSLTAGAGGQNGWPTYAFDSLGVGWGGYNYGVVGMPLTTMISRAAGTIDPLLVPGLKNIVTAMEFTNLMADDTVSAATAEGDYQTYCSARQTAGWKVVAATYLPCTSAAVVNPTSFETKRQTINAWIRANYTNWADALADVGGDATIGQAGDTTNATYYQSDQVHLTNAGAQIAAGYFQTAIASL